MKKLTFTSCAATALLVATVCSTAFAQVRPTESEESISVNDRFGAIADIVATWNGKGSFAKGWEEEFTVALNGASDEQLLAIQAAESYQEVNVILLGGLTPADNNALGDILSDLVYTPVVPCRFFDTRWDNVAGAGHTTGSTATTRSYQVHGTASQLWHQGYNKGVNSGAGCPAPDGEPVAIAANFTAAGTLGNGNIRAWPVGGSLPNVSLVNYTTGVNIANAGIVATGYLVGDDINITMQYGTVDGIGDVTGYFYPAPVASLSNTALHGYDLSQATISSSNDEIFINPNSGSSTFTFSGGEEVIWWSSAMVYKTGSVVPNDNVNGEFESCYRNTSTDVLTCHGFVGQTDFCFQSSGNLDMKSVQTAGRVASMPAGTYEFGFMASMGASCGGNQNNYVVRSTKISVIKLEN